MRETERSTKEALRRRLDEDPVLALWFAGLCDAGTQAIEAQAWQVAPTDSAADVDDARDALLELARELLPDSPAGRATGEEKDAVLGEALRWLSANGVSYGTRLTEHEDGMARSYAEDPLPVFKTKVRAWMKELAARPRAS